MKFGLVLAVLLCTVLPLSCTKPTVQDQKTIPTNQTAFSVPVSSDAPTILYYSPLKNQPFSHELPEPVDFLPYSSQQRPAALMELDSDSILAAINKSGFVQLQISANNSRLSLSTESDIAIQNVPVAQYSTGNFWRSGNHTFLLLYSNPVFDNQWLPSIVYEFYGDTVAPLSIPQHPASSSYALYRVFPADTDQWLLQYRLTEKDKTYSAYSRWDKKTNKNTAITMTQFEQVLAPIQFTKMQGEIARLLEVIKTPVLLEYKTQTGAIRYISNGNIDDAVLGIAETSAHGTFILTEDGRYWILKNKNAKTGITGSHIVSGQFSVPVENPIYTSAILTDTVFIALWEETRFPDTGRSGLLALALE